MSIQSRPITTGEETIGIVREEYKMKMQEIREIANAWGVNMGVIRSKQDIVREIQIKEGYEPCFRTKAACQNDCLWKKDCTNGR
jgi:hypothetical protein